jgi:hypothetical protein
MTDQDDARKRVIRVPTPEVVDPGSRGPQGSSDDDVLVSPADIGSASRSCLAILVVLLIIALLLCVFIVVQPFID